MTGALIRRLVGCHFVCEDIETLGDMRGRKPVTAGVGTGAMQLPAKDGQGRLATSRS